VFDFAGRGNPKASNPKTRAIQKAPAVAGRSARLRVKKPERRRQQQNRSIRGASGHIASAFSERHSPDACIR
jgi:hypothetical protein